MERLGTTVRLSHEVRDKQLLKLWIVLSWEMKLKNFLASPGHPAGGLRGWGLTRCASGERKRIQRLNWLDLGLSPVGAVELAPARD